MQLSDEYQELVDFFTSRELPQGPQHVNEYSVFLDLSGAIETHLQRLYSDVEASRKSAAVMLLEVKSWLTSEGI